jgi:hypothetical protein
LSKDETSFLKQVLDAFKNSIMEDRETLSLYIASLAACLPQQRKQAAKYECLIKPLAGGDSVLRVIGELMA